MCSGNLSCSANKARLHSWLSDTPHLYLGDPPSKKLVHHPAVRTGKERRRWEDMRERNFPCLCPCFVIRKALKGSGRYESRAQAIKHRAAVFYLPPRESLHNTWRWPGESLLLRLFCCRRCCCSSPAAAANLAINKEAFVSAL